MVWHHSLLLMNSFNKTEAAFFVQAMLPEGFPFHQIDLVNISPVKQIQSDSVNLKSYHFVLVTED